MAIYRGSGGSVEGITESDVVTIAISQGGTGANTAAGARTNLGLGTAATTDASAYATAAQGTLADSAVQPGDISEVATSNSYNDLDDLPTLGTAAATDADEYATAAQGALADSAVQPADIGTAAAEDVGYFATAAQGSLADSALQSDDIGVSIQAYDAQLADVAGLTATDNGVIIGNGTNFVVESGATLRTSLGLAIGTDVLAPNGSAASLTSFPTLNQNTTGTADNVTGVVAIANGGTGQTTAVNARAALLPTYATNAGKVLAVKADASDVEYIAVGGSGTVTSVDMSVPTGLSVSGNPVTTSGTLAVTYSAGYAIPTTAKQTEWDTAYTDRLKWDGGSTGLDASTGRTSLGLGTAATTAATDYATAAQGSNADTAYGWGNHASAGYAADSAVVHDTGDETIAGVKTFSDNIIGAGNLTLSGTAKRITGDFSNATVANRVMFQTTTAASPSRVGVIPNGTTTAELFVANAETPTNAQVGTLTVTSTEVRVQSTAYGTGTGSYLPMAFYTGGSERMRIDTSGNVGIGTSSPSRKLHVYGGSTGTRTMVASGNASEAIEVGVNASNIAAINAVAGGAIIFTQADTERARIDSSGNLLVGTTSNGGLSGNIVCPGIYNRTSAVAANMGIDAAYGMFRSTSALKYKKDVRDIENVDISLLRPVRYKSKCEGDDQTKDHFGLIADEVAQAGFEELVTRGAEGEIEGFQYERLTVVLLKAIQEQQAQISSQAAVITTLTERITALESQ